MKPGNPFFYYLIYYYKYLAIIGLTLSPSAIDKYGF